jgi:hypothetical protein
MLGGFALLVRLRVGAALVPNALLLQLTLLARLYGKKILHSALEGKRSARSLACAPGACHAEVLHARGSA